MTPCLIPLAADVTTAFEGVAVVAFDVVPDDAVIERTEGLGSPADLDPDGGCTAVGFVPGRDAEALESAMGQIVVYRIEVFVTTLPIGQLVTAAKQDVIVETSVV